MAEVGEYIVAVAARANWWLGLSVLFAAVPYLSKALLGKKRHAALTDHTAFNATSGCIALAILFWASFEVWRDARATSADTEALASINQPRPAAGRPGAPATRKSAAPQRELSVDRAAILADLLQRADILDSKHTETLGSDAHLVDISEWQTVAASALRQHFDAGDLQAFENAPPQRVTPWVGMPLGVEESIGRYRAQKSVLRTLN